MRGTSKRCCERHIGAVALHTWRKVMQDSRADLVELDSRVGLGTCRLRKQHVTSLVQQDQQERVLTGEVPHA